MVRAQNPEPGQDSLPPKPFRQGSHRSPSATHKPISQVGIEVETHWHPLPTTSTHALPAVAHTPSHSGAVADPHGIMVVVVVLLVVLVVVVLLVVLVVVVGVLHTLD